MSSDSLDTSTFDGLASEFSAKDNANKEFSSTRNVSIKSSPQDILSPFYNICNAMTKSELEATFFLYKFLQWIQLKHPKPDEKVDDALAKGWEPFYLKHIEIGLWFPIIGLVKE